MAKGRHLKWVIDNPTQMKSRREAHDLMRSLHPEIDWHIHCVHHRDENPFNNDPENLLIVTKKAHIQHHRKPEHIQKSKTKYRVEIFTKTGSVTVWTSDEMEFTIEGLLDDSRVMEVIILDDQHREIKREIRR